MIIAIIPARAGSKGVPGKNHKIINGKPLIQWSIDAALACPHISQTIVSSNCPEVEKIVASCISDSLHFLQRPEKISDDNSKTEEALFHAVEWAVNEKGWTPKWVMTLQPTSPVRNNQLLTQCCKKVLASDMRDHYDSLMTCSSHTPFFYVKNRMDDALPLDHNPCARPMRQNIGDWEMYLHDNGNCYMTETSRLLMYQCRTGKTCAVVPTTSYQSWQIDAPEDFVILEAMSQAFGPFI